MHVIGERLKSSPIVYMRGEEMTRYVMWLLMRTCVQPHLDTSQWRFYDLSCQNRDLTNDQVLEDAVEEGLKVRCIFKEPTITPSAAQIKSLGLSRALPSPNGMMRRRWRGVTMSRDTIHIEGVKLGYEAPVLFDRQPVGGEYGAKWGEVGRGVSMTLFFPEGQSKATIIDERVFTDERNTLVTYHNPLDTTHHMAHHFFKRCLVANVTPYIVTKKTVFQWQESFWEIMKEVFDAHYKEAFTSQGLLEKTDGRLAHLISDAATMKLVQWRCGGFGMAAHNYDADMLTDEMSQIHKSPGFITSTLLGKTKGGDVIKQFEASHGTAADLWKAHRAGESTSFVPLGLVEALTNAICYAEEIGEQREEVVEFAHALRAACHRVVKEDTMETEAFVQKMAEYMR